MRAVLAIVCWIVLGTGAVPALAQPNANTPAARAWRNAQRLFYDTDPYDPGAWEAWNAVARDFPETPQGREARSLLDEANAHFLGALAELLGPGDARGVADQLYEGLEIAPMDPRIALRIADACEARQWASSRTFYRSYVDSASVSADPELRRELTRARAKLAGDGLSGFRVGGQRDREQMPATPIVIDRGIAPGTVAAFAGGITFILVVVVVLLTTLRRRGPSLARLAHDAPELHPAIAYLVGCLRHELLKHRVAAVGDAVHAFSRGDASPAQREFLLSRLFQGEPLTSAWEGHLQAFERALGPRVDLRRDRAFRLAGGALRTIEKLEPRIRRGEAGAAPRLSRAFAVLRAFDRQLAALAHSLVRTTIDRALLEQVVREVRSEYSASLVELDELRIDDPPPGVSVEVFRVDLVLILKNLLRNAVLAVGRSGTPRRVALGVRLDVEPTGEEVARIRVQDTSPEKLTTDAIHERGVGAGLGLVTVALARYDGAIEVDRGEDGYAKSVNVRFFRALDEEPAHAQAA